MLACCSFHGHRAAEVRSVYGWRLLSDLVTTRRRDEISRRRASRRRERARYHLLRFTVVVLRVKPPHTSDGAHAPRRAHGPPRSALARPQKPRTQQLPTTPSQPLDPTHPSPLVTSTRALTTPTKPGSCPVPYSACRISEAAAIWIATDMRCMTNGVNLRVGHVVRGPCVSLLLGAAHRGGLLDQLDQRRAEANSETK
jgi:hypothetical protein